MIARRSAATWVLWVLLHLHKVDHTHMLCLMTPMHATRQLEHHPHGHPHLGSYRMRVVSGSMQPHGIGHRKLVSTEQHMLVTEAHVDQIGWVLTIRDDPAESITSNAYALRTQGWRTVRSLSLMLGMMLHGRKATNSVHTIHFELNSHRHHKLYVCVFTIASSKSPRNSQTRGAKWVPFSRSCLGP